MLSLVLYPFPSCYECSQGQNQGKENPVTNYNMKWRWQEERIEMLSKLLGNQGKDR